VIDVMVSNIQERSRIRARQRETESQEPEGRYAATLLQPTTEVFSRWALGRHRSPIVRKRRSPRRQRHVDRLVTPVPRDQQLVQLGSWSMSMRCQ
jgi:hypothetical protein